MLARSPQAAEAPPLPAKPDDKEAAMAEIQAFRPLAVPRRVRYRNQILAVAGIAAIVGLSVLGVDIWRSFGPSPLDAVSTEIAEPPKVLLPDVQRVPPPATPVARPAVDVAPQRRAEPAASRGTITHTRRADSAPAVAAGARPSQQPVARAPEPRPVVQAECSEAVAALGLCASTQSSKASQ